MISNERTHNTILNAISSILLTLANGILGIIVTKIIIETYGSDFNGLNSTASQIVNILLVIEGGFTIASTVVLFKPFSRKEYEKANDLLCITKRKFETIGIKLICIGFITSLVYTFLVNSGLSRSLIFTVIFITIIPVAFNLYYATTYRVILQAFAKEYIINFFSCFTISLGHITNIIVIYCGGSIWCVRCIAAVYAILNSFLITWYVTKRYKFVNIQKTKIVGTIPGTKDVMIQKITGVLYNSFPIFILSIFPNAGTLVASVYAVYNNIFTMIKSILHGIIDAPRLSLGQIIALEEKENIWDIFFYYQYISFIAIYIFICTSFGLVLPFISILTSNIVDISYYDKMISVLMTVITVIEMLHIPSGQLLNMSGCFKIMKNFQLLSSIILILIMPIGCYFWGIYGLLISVLIVSIVLAFLEITYVHLFFFNNKLVYVLKVLLPFIILGILTCTIEIYFICYLNSMMSFVFVGTILFTINFVVSIAITFLFNRNLLLGMLRFIS